MLKGAFDLLKKLGTKQTHLQYVGLDIKWGNENIKFLCLTKSWDLMVIFY
jgi:hypothetical protein